MSTTKQTPFIDPNIRDPRALRYQQELQKRKHQDPVGGPIPLPRAIPDLTGEAPSRPMTMEQAGLLESRADSIVVDKPEAKPPMLLPTDLLPEEAVQDPAFKKGVGSNLAMLQPELAYKYGIIRNGKHLVPKGSPMVGMAVKPPPPPPGQLREETVQGLSQLAKDQQKKIDSASNTVEPTTTETAKVDNIGSSPMDDMDVFDIHRLRAALSRDILNNDEQRKIIEARLQPISIDEILISGTVVQKVPVIPGKFEPIFEHVSGEVDLELKALVGEKCKALDLGEQYFLDMYALYTLAAGTQGINSLRFPDYRENGQFNKERFKQRYEKVSRLIAPMLASLAANFTWFDQRVKRLFRAETIKNG